MYSLRVENHKGDVLNFSNNRNYSINRIEGLNPPPATVNRTVMTNAPGSKLNSVQTPERNIVIYIKPEGDIEKSRIELYKYFPQEKSVTLYFKNGSRDVRISGVVESCELCHFDMPQIAQVSIICPEPYFIDNTERQIRLSDIIALFEFPFSIPAEGIEFSAIETNTRKNIYTE